MNIVKNNVELNLYKEYLKKTGAFVSGWPQTIPSKVRKRLTEMGIDWQNINEIPVPHKTQYIFKKGPDPCDWYVVYDWIYPPTWTAEDKKRFEAFAGRSTAHPYELPEIKYTGPGIY